MPGRPPSRKFGNTRTLGPAPWGGQIVYQSAAEAREAYRHEREKNAGQIRAWAIQVSLPVAYGARGYKRHVVDFLAVLQDGSLRIRETKGFDHARGAEKRRDLEALGFEVELVR